MDARPHRIGFYSVRIGKTPRKTRFLSAQETDSVFIEERLDGMCWPSDAASRMLVSYSKSHAGIKANTEPKGETVGTASRGHGVTLTLTDLIIRLLPVACILATAIGACILAAAMGACIHLPFETHWTEGFRWRPLPSMCSNILAEADVWPGLVYRPLEMNPQKSKGKRTADERIDAKANGKRECWCTEAWGSKDGVIASAGGAEKGISWRGLVYIYSYTYIYM